MIKFSWKYVPVVHLMFPFANGYSVCCFSLEQMFSLSVQTKASTKYEPQNANSMDIRSSASRVSVHIPALPGNVDLGKAGLKCSKWQQC